MYCSKVIVSVLLLGSFHSFGQDPVYNIVFCGGKSEVSTPEATKKGIDKTIVCPIDPPIGYDVYGVILYGEWCKLAGKWSRLSEKQKTELWSHFRRRGAVQGTMPNTDVVYLVCGTQDLKDPRLSMLEQYLLF